MNKIPRCDCYPSGQDGAMAAHSRFLAWFRKIKDPFFRVLSHIINPLLTKLVVSRGLDIGLVTFFLTLGQ